MPLNDPEEEGVKPAPKEPDEPPADDDGEEDSKRPRDDDDNDKEDSSPDNEKRARIQGKDDDDDKNIPKGPPMPPPNFPGAMMMPYPMFGLAPPGMFAMAQAKGPAAGDNKQQDEGKQQQQDDDTPPNNKQPQVVMMPYPPPFMMPAFLAMQQQRRPRSVGIGLSMACDVEQLSDYQILVRQQLELFEASQEDVESNTQGRKKPVALNQVGLRCRHCAGFALRQRGRGAVYYPSTLFGIYQAAQNMAGSHLCVACQHIPLALKQELRKLRQQRDNASGGKQYWADGCRALGIYQDEACLRLRRRPPQQQEQEASEQQNAAKDAPAEPATSSV